MLCSLRYLLSRRYGDPDVRKLVSKLKDAPGGTYSRSLSTWRRADEQPRQEEADSSEEDRGKAQDGDGDEGLQQVDDGGLDMEASGAESICGVQEMPIGRLSIYDSMNI
ncbi:MAG: hypothetical protein QW292_03905 [Candidatus Parvarchaeota archaeon]